MTSLYEILKASKTGIASDLLTALRGRQYAASLIQERELEGVPPLTFNANGEPLISWTIYGNMQQSGTPSSSTPITPSETGERTSNLLNLKPFAENYQGKITFDNGVFDVSIASQDMYTTGISVDIPANTTFSCVNITKDSQSIRGRLKFIFDDNTTQDVLITLSDGTTAQNPVVSFAKAITAIRLDWSTFNNGFSFKLAMLNAGSTAFPYEPYGFKLPVQCGGVVTPVYLNEPIRKIGEYADYKSNAAEYRVTKKLVLTGEEDWVNAGHSWRIEQSDIRRSASQTVVCDGYMSHYQAQQFNNIYNGRNTGFGIPATAGWISVCDLSLNSVDDFQNFLRQQYAAGTPVTIWYVLATPITTTVEAPEIPTVNGSNTFDVDTTLKPSKVYIKYKG